jgi:hypothetical protein
MRRRHPVPIDPRLKIEPKSRTLSDDLIVMLAGLAVLIAGTGIIPYVAALFEP